MRKAALLAGLLMLSAAGFAAEEIEPLEGAFLEYLGNLEGDEDDWTLLVDAQDPPTAPPEDAQASKPARETPKEPAKPAVDER